MPVNGYFTGRNGKVKTKEDPQFVSREVYDKHIGISSIPGTYFKFNRLVMKIIPGMTAIFLQDIANLSSLKSTIKKKVGDKEFVKMTVGFLENSEIGWSEDKQRYHLTALEEKGFITVIRSGTTAQRWIYINWLEINTAVAAILDGMGTSAQGETPLTEENTEDLEVQEENQPSEKPQSRGKPRHWENRGSVPGKTPSLGKPREKNKQHNESIRTSNKTPPTPPTGGSERSGLPEEKRKKGSSSCFGEEAARITIEGLRKAGKLSEIPSGKKLADWVSRYEGLAVSLVRLRESPREKIEDHVLLVLKDHVANVRDRFQPSVFCAKTICREFVRLEEAMERRSNGTNGFSRNGNGSYSASVQAVVPVKVSPEALEIVKWLEPGRHWPKGSAAQLPQAVQESLEGFRAVQKAAKKLRDSADLAVRGFAKYLYEHGLSSPKFFVDDFFARQYDRISEWEGWSGILQAFRPGTKMFLRTGREMAQEFTGEPSMWDAFAEAARKEGLL